jgi:RimJ/RimL family protein N-acetyltransferase
MSGDGPRTHPPSELRTKRVVLRLWKDEDRAPFAALNADPQVMEHFPKTLTREESDAMVDRIRMQFAERGFGLWALEIPEVASFAGFVGLAYPHLPAPSPPQVEGGWRIAAAHWGQGYATEAARAAVRFGFETLNLSEIVSMTVPANVRSRRVMEKLGMTRSPAEDFDHPKLAPGHPLRRHVLYRLRRPPDSASLTP